MTILQLIFWLLLVDSLGAAYFTWVGGKEKYNSIRFLKRYLPLTSGWTLWYMILVLFIGYTLYFS